MIRLTVVEAGGLRDAQGRFARINSAATDDARDRVQMVGDLLESEMRRRVPSRTGELSASIKASVLQVAGSKAVVNITALDRARYVLPPGTRAHIIFPKRAKSLSVTKNGKRRPAALQFYWESIGKVITVAWVKIPRHYVRNDWVQESIDEVMKPRGENVLRRVSKVWSVQSSYAKR